MPRSSNATASAFGWEFQSNAAIMLMLKNIVEASKVKIEGENEDVEITFSDGKMLMAQAKAVEAPDDFRNVKGKLIAGLQTLDVASKIAEIDQLVMSPIRQIRLMMWQQCISLVANLIWFCFPNCQRVASSR